MKPTVGIQSNGWYDHRDPARSLLDGGEIAKK